MSRLDLWKRRLGFGTASALLFAVGTMGTTNVIAQDTEASADSDEEEVEEVVVTGSRLRRSSQTSNVPLNITTSVEIENRGFTNVIDALNDDPIFVNNTTNQGNQVQNGDSFSFANILGLGTQRTLVLFNGRRFVGSNQGTVFVPGNATGAQVDLSIINPALLERTETTIASGGAVYGADAVAGAVNLITKDDFEGASVLTVLSV